MRSTVDGAALRDLVHVLTAEPIRQPPGEAACISVDVLSCLERLIPCDTAVYNDYATRHWSDSVYADTGPASGPAPDEDDQDRIFAHHYWTGACSRHDRVGDYETVIILTDLMSLREWRTCPMVVDLQTTTVGRMFDRDLMIPLPGAPGHSRRVRFERMSGRDFGYTDRALATFLRPLLVDHVRALDLVSQGTAPLTARQQHLMSFVADGLTNAQVARRLGITEATVRTHLQQIYARLGVSSRSEAAAVVRWSGDRLTLRRPADRGTG